MTNTFTLNPNENVYTFMDTLRSSENIETGLTKIAANHGIPAAEAAEIAQKILRSVNNFDDCYTEVEEDTVNAMHSFFKTLEKKSLEDRIVIMERVIFNLNAFSNDELIEKMEKGVSVHTLFEKAIPVSDTGDPVAYELKLRYYLLEAVENMNLSPKATRRMAKKLASYQSFSLNSEYVGREHLKLKCAATLHIYLEHQGEYSAESAAAYACSYLYMDQAAKAVRLGQITEEVAEGILCCIIVTAMFLTEAYLIISGVHTVISAFTAFFLAIGGFCAADGLSRKISVRVTPVLQEGIDQVQEGFNRITSFIESRREAAKKAKAETDALREIMLHTDIEEDLDQAVYCF